MRRRGPVIVQCTDSVVFPISVYIVRSIARELISFATVEPARVKPNC